MTVLFRTFGGQRKLTARLLSTLVVLALLAGSVLAAPAPLAHATTAVETVDFADLLDVNRAMDHTIYLSEEIGPRVSGFPGEQEGAMYIKEQLESWGYEVTLEPFSRPDRTMGMFALSSGEVWQVGSAPNGRQTGDETVSGELVWAGTGLSDDQFPDDVEGKIVVMVYGSNNSQRNTQVTNAYNRGAAAVVLANQQGARGARGGTPTPSISTPRDIPIIGIGQGQGEQLRDRLADGETITGTIQTRLYTGLVSYNVIGTRKAAGPDADSAPVVYMGSHLDSVLGSPGANDSAASVAISLEMARVMAQYGAGDKEVRFAYWGSEESGLIGSTRHVNGLPQSEIDRIIADFQPDMIATNSDRVTHLLAHSVDGKPNLVTESARIAAEKRSLEEYYQQGQFGSSDHVPFHNKGIPAALFIWMTYESTQNYQLEDKYHTPEDTVEENISIERMQIALEIIGQALFDIVQPPPALTISSPVDGFSTQRSSVIVEGNASDPQGPVTVNVAGEEVELDEDGNFREPVILDDGANDIVITATAADGRVNTVTLRVYSDNDAPVLTDLEPGTDVTIEQTESVTVSFNSEPGLTAGFDVILPGAFKLMSFGLGTPMTETSPGHYEGTYTAPADVLFAGAEIWFNAVDAAGNLTQQKAAGTLTVVPYVAPPELTITSPAPDTRTGSDVITVSGQASDDTGIVSVTVNGRKANVAADGTFSTRIILNEGDNVVTVVATAGSGKQTTATVNVTAVWSPPTLSALEPAEDIELVAGESYVFRFTAAPGLTAAYQVVLGGASGTTVGKGTPKGTAMTEVSPGVYEATYTAPANTTFSGAAIRFNVADDLGNLIMTTAPGRLTVLAAVPAP